MTILARLDPADLPAPSNARIPPEVLSRAEEIVADVRTRGIDALKHYANTFQERLPGKPLFLDRGELESALDSMSAADRGRLERVTEQIRAFATAQRDSLTPMSQTIHGCRAGHDITPVERAGCYAPGGRYPLPSSVLMTAVTARAAGVSSVWVASPRPAAITLAAAAVAGADGLLAAGGAHAIAALAYGAGPIPPSDVVVGPGNSYVTAAKKLIAGEVAIDMLAGPSELVVLADESSDPAIVAADLLAQAEHDDEALPLLVTTSERVVCAVESQIASQLDTLPTRVTARNALDNGGAVVCDSLEHAISVCNDLAPEHLQVSVAAPEEIVPRLRHWGGLFVGEASAEVFGDYGAGPNHVLPTGRTARSVGGLSVFNFLRVRTWLRCADSTGNEQLIEDSAWLARLEGLEAHARAAEKRRQEKGGSHATSSSPR